ncbi:MAG: hypothetical protein AVDCRST_MAG55-2336, partial [uncultured Rubrobacteraceae bacterium]
DFWDAEHRFSTERLRWKLRPFLPRWVRFHVHHSGLYGGRVPARSGSWDAASFLASRDAGWFRGGTVLPLHGLEAGGGRL